MGNQYPFGCASVYAIDSDGLPQELMSISDITLDFSRDAKELVTRRAFADIMALGKGKISGKGTINVVNEAAMTQLYNGVGTSEKGQRLWAQESFTLASGVSTYTAENAANFYQDLGVKKVVGSTNSKILTPTLSTPSIGEYKCSSGVYTFNSNDTSAGMSGLASYLYSKDTTAGARTYTVTTNFVAADTLIVGGATLTATASTTDATNFAVGSTIADTVANIATALAANSTVNAIYTVTHDGTAFTLTETVAGSDNTPAVATYTGTGVVSSGTATASVDAGGNIITLNNVKQAAATFFSMLIQGDLINKQNESKQMNVWLNCCLSNKIGLAWKSEAFNGASFNFEAASDDLNSLGWMSIGA